MKKGMIVDICLLLRLFVCFSLGGGGDYTWSLTVVFVFKIYEYTPYCYGYKPSKYTKLLIQTKYRFVKTLKYNITSVVLMERNIINITKVFGLTLLVWFSLYPLQF